jgi:AcrR family transcriptional regulator
MPAMDRRRPIGALYDRFLRKAPKQSRSRSVVEAVLEAAADLLPQHGDDDQVTLNDIAARAGVGVGSLYDYFADRSSVLAGLAAKITEDNLRAFEDQLERSLHEPLPVAIRGLVDLMFDTYLGNVHIPRAVLRVAHRVGLMPTIADSQNAFASALAASLRQRTDVRKDDLDVVAYVVTNMAMGIIHTAIWSEKQPVTDPQLRASLTQACLRFLTAEPPSA